jgi:hypothetical protein
MFVFVIAMAQTIDITSSSRLFIDTDHEFGFVAGATATITISGAENRTIIGLLPDSMIARYYYNVPDPEDFCFGNETISAIQTFGDGPSVRISTLIQSRDLYAPFYFSCYSARFHFEAQYYFYNDGSHLDYRWHPSMIAYPVFIAVSSFFLLVWLVNWACHFTRCYPMHFCITLAIATVVTTNTLSFVLLRKEDRDGTVPLSIRISISIITDICRAHLLMTVFLTGKGWSLVRQKVPLSELPMALLTALFFTIGHEALTYFSTLGTASIAISVVEIVCLFAFIHFLAQSVRGSEVAMVAHFLAIQDAGLDPAATLAFPKYRAVMAYYRILTIYCVLLIFAVVFNLFLASMLWLGPCLMSVMDVGICAVLVSFMRLRRREKSLYMFLDDDAPIVLAPAPLQLSAELPAADDDAEPPSREPPGPALAGDADEIFQNPYDSPEL